MDSFIKMDIFFVVTTVVVVMLGVLAAIALAYLISLFRTLDRIASQVHEEAAEIREDLQELRRKTKREGLRLQHLRTFFGKTAKRGKKKIRAADD